MKINFKLSIWQLLHLTFIVSSAFLPGLLYKIIALQVLINLFKCHFSFRTLKSLTCNLTVAQKNFYFPITVFILHFFISYYSFSTHSLKIFGNSKVILSIPFWFYYIKLLFCFCTNTFAFLVLVFFQFY